MAKVIILNMRKNRAGYYRSFPKNITAPSKSQADELKEESRKGKLTEKRVADIFKPGSKKGQYNDIF